MESYYKLSISLYGHDQDVRAVAPAYFPVGSFLSSSRDRSTKLWVPNDSDPYIESLCLGGHQGFVTCVCVMSPDDKYPHGVILTGSTDNSILAYTLDSPSPIYKLEGHADTVSALGCGKFGMILSGSWDTTAKVWLNCKNVMTLTGHEAAIWSVATFPSGGYILTGSADKSIKLWKAGKCEKTYKGHTDCVRGIAVISNSEFLSCANDALVIKWNVSGERIHTFSGHANYIYSIALLSNGTDFVTGSEDRTIRIWKDGKCVQTIAHPTQTVWSVCSLPNGDIVSGASDGCIRVFSCDPLRIASDEVLQAYEDEVSKGAIPAQIGDIKTDELPGPEILLSAGRRDGQRVMVKDGNSIALHQWSDCDAKWQKIGDILGGTGKDKSTYLGKEYDYVFDVDIQEGMPPLKLPYNKSDNPYMAAQKFLEDNEISQSFLDQVADFIMKQTKDVEIGAPQYMNNPDPFTGGNSQPLSDNVRHIPYNTQPVNLTGNHFQSQDNPDPFTGSVRFVGSEKDLITPKQLFPQKTCISFDTANIGAIIKKIKGLNANVAEIYKVDDNSIESLENPLSQKNPQLNENQIDTLKSLCSWPKNIIFPVLDILRLFIRSEVFFNTYVNNLFEDGLVVFIEGILANDSSQVNQMLALRIFSNLFCHEAGQKMMIEKKEEIHYICENCKDNANNNIMIALCTVLLNFSVITHHTGDMNVYTKIISLSATLIQLIQDNEAHYRLMMALGTLCWDSSFGKSMLLSYDDIKTYVKKFANTNQEKRIQTCASSLLYLLNNDSDE